VSDTERIAESWELSVHTEGVNFTEHNMPLDEVLTPQMLGKYSNGKLGVLVKFLNAAENLSVQVHPNDAYAKQFCCSGKREMWYILDCEPGSKIYCGFKKDMCVEVLQEALDSGTILEHLNAIKVKPGDSFFIETGTIHAIGKGITLCEVHQSSNLTYRLYDYGRLGKDGSPRDLHIKEALEVCNLKQSMPQVLGETLGDGYRRLVRCKQFSVFEWAVQGTSELEDKDSFMSVTVVEGSGQMNGRTVTKGETYFVPCGCVISVESEYCKMIVAKVEGFC